MSNEWESFTNQKQWEGYIKKLLRTNDKALLRSIVLIYERQTDEEKYVNESINENSVGFSKVDAKEMGVIAQKIKRHEKLSEGELAKSRNKMQKYWKQLMVISKEKIEQRNREDQELLFKRKEEEVRIFKENLEVIRRCSEEGISCDYGICDECPLTNGIQLRLF